MLPLLERLSESPVIADGALGTYLHQGGYDLHTLSETLVLTEPQSIAAAHQAYLDAGAELIETHTFAANPLTLRRDAPGVDARELHTAAAQLALQAAKGRAYVAGAIGPAQESAEFSEAELSEAYEAHAAALVDAGVHLLILETFPHLRALLPALDAARRAANGKIPIAAQLLFADGFEGDGVTAQDAAARLIQHGAQIIGANCGRGLQSIRTALPGLLAAAKDRAFVSLFPNAGYPEQINGRTAYLLTPDYLGGQAREWAARGARLIGGCCGTTPESIAAIRRAITTLRKFPAWPTPFRATISFAPAAAPSNENKTPARPGAFLDAVADIHLPVIAEIDPPPHLNAEPMMTGARALLQHGAHAISLADNPLASIRMDPFSVGARLHRETQAPVICHLTCRDRNQHALQSTLMAAHMNHVAGVLCVTGDPFGQHRGTAVYEVNSLGLLRLVAKLNLGHSHTGRNLNGGTNFSPGVAFNSAARNLHQEVGRLRQKHALGAVFTMTQPVFDIDTARRILDATRLPGLRVFLGFMPPLSAKLANYLHNEVPGISLPQKLLDQLNALEQPADQEKAALDATHALFDQLAPELDGIYLITPGLRYAPLLPLLDQLNTLRKSPNSHV